jgi:monoterpene epsilon-lactone hydrolase
MATTKERVESEIALEPGGPPTLQARIANRVIRALVRSVWAYGPPGPAGMRFVHRITTSIPYPPPPRGVRVEQDDFGAFGGEWVRAGRTDESKVFLYLHGGGYFFGSPLLYRPLTWRLSAATGRPVLALGYRLAPEHTPADALHDALTAYEGLLSQGYSGADIVVGGDSAGGHLALALLLALRDRERPLPAAAVTLSPWADLECTADSHATNARTDHLIPANRLAWAGRYYCEGKKQDDALFAPIRGDYSGLPPLLVISSGSEILRDDARAVVARARAAGVHVVHQEWEGLVHVFPLFADYIPEGRAAYRHIARFLAQLGG